MTPRIKWLLEVPATAALLSTRVRHTDAGHVGEVLYKGEVIAWTDALPEALGAKAAAERAIGREYPPPAGKVEVADAAPEDHPGRA